jgi:hypothetical protein
MRSEEEIKKYLEKLEQTDNLCDKCCVISEIEILEWVLEE